MPTPIDDLLKELHDMKGFIEDKIKIGIVPLKEEQARMDAALAAALKVVEEWKRDRAAKLDDYGKLIVREGKFAGLSAMELGIVRSIIDGRMKEPGMRLVKPSTVESLHQAEQSLRTQVTFDMVERWVDLSLTKGSIMASQDTKGPGLMRLRDSLNNWKADFYRQINLAMDSTTTGAGSELVPTLEAAEVWMDVNLFTKVLPLFVQQPMPSNPFDIPVQFGNVNWYPTVQNVQGTTTDLTTGKTTLTAYGLRAGVPFSDELEEDAIIAVAAEIRSTLARNAAQVIDDVLLNADTTTGTTNTTFDGGNITTSLAGKAQELLGFNGLYVLPYTNNTAQRIRVAGALSNTTYNNLALKLGKYFAPQTRGDVVYIAPVNVVIKTLQLAQVETIEKYGPRATISAGEISSIYGTPLIMSEQFGLVDTTGKIRSASSNNTTGRILAVNTSQWRTGFRRQITFEPIREPGKSQTTLYLSFRIAFAERSGTRSTATHTAAAYDISSVT